MEYWSWRPVALAMTNDELMSLDIADLLRHVRAHCEHMDPRVHVNRVAAQMLSDAILAKMVQPPEPGVASDEHENQIYSCRNAHHDLIDWLIG